jgi:DNA-binding MarR family transcriptional regulator
MSVSLHHRRAREALLSAARKHSPADELRCRALLDLLQTSHSLQRALRRKLAPNTLTVTGFYLLAHLAQEESNGVTAGRLAKDLSLSPQVVSASLGRLEISGLITRERSSDDRRVLAIKVSTAGRRAFASALAHYVKAIKGVMSALEPRDLATLERIIARLTKASAPVTNS